jgi:phenylpropionate dioxygenase-like ring-hydroxylating dioxygenase large terminal subunit
VRASAEELKAFHNACRHRGTQLKQGCGRAKSIQCPYHFWTWNLDGTIKSVTESSDFVPGQIAAELLSLVEVRLEVWGGFVFVTMDLDAAPLSDFLGTAADALAPYHLDDLRYTRYRTTILETNWKTAFDAFNEIYHTQAIHPQTLRFTDFTQWRHELHGPHGVNVPNPGIAGRPDPRVGELSHGEVLMSLMEAMQDVDLMDNVDEDVLTEAIEAIAALPEEEPMGPVLARLRRQMAASQGLDLSAFEDDEVIIGSIWSLFPNVSMAVNGSSAFILRFRPNGWDPNSCIVDVWSLEWSAPAEEPKSIEREYYANWRDHEWDLILTQDLENLPNVQRGIRSRGFQHAICGSKETTVANFHRALNEFLDRPGRP